MLCQEGFGPIDGGFNEVALNEGISKSKDSIMDVLLDVIGDIFDHSMHILNMGIFGVEILNGRLAEQFQ